MRGLAFFKVLDVLFINLATDRSGNNFNRYPV